MRLFIAIPIPEFVKEQLIDLQQPIDGVRWQDNQFHITLKFLGDTDPELAEKVRLSLREVDLPAFNITLKEFGYFPKGKQPRVLWTGIKKEETLMQLHEEVVDRCAKLGFEPEDRKFKPHITIARINGTPKRDVMSFINQHKQFQIQGVLVDEFVLYESKLDPDGAKHIRFETFPLAGE